MDYPNYINEFLDGTLSPDAEQELFAAMASDPELRRELHHFVDIERAVSKDFAAFTPSGAVTAGIFSSLGMSSTPAEAVITPTPIPVETTASTGFWTASSSILSGALLSALITSLVLLFSFDFDGNNFIEEANSPLITKQKIHNQINQEPVPSKQALIAQIIDSLNKHKKEPKGVIRYIDRPYIPEGYVLASSLKTNEEKATAPKSKPIFRDISISKLAGNITEFPINMNTDNSQNFNQTFVPQIVAYSPIATESIFPFENISFEIRGGEYFSIPGATVEQSSMPYFENASFGLFYSFNDWFSLGGDIRQEFFFQDFTGMEDNIKYQYRQHTNYISVGLMAKIRFFEYRGFETFSQFGISGSRPGAIGRGLFGVSYSPYGKIAFVLGLEGSILEYTHNDNSFYSSKLGLHYGIRVNL